MTQTVKANTNPLQGEVSVQVDDSFQTLSFRTKEGAERFADLCHLYQDESGAGNGYGAYWHFRDEPIVAVDTARGVADLDQVRIRQMLGSIIRNRLGGTPYQTTPIGIMRIESDGETIDFDFDPARLPPRLAPKPGDLVRILDHPEMRRGEIARAGATDGNTVQLHPCHYGMDKEVRVPVTSVMKIPDFLNRK